MTSALSLPQIAKLMSLLFCAILFSSCAHQVKYRLTKEDQWGGPQVDKVVKVVPFKDDAPKDEKINIRIGKDLYRVNGREGYPEGEISPAMARMMARHLEHSGLFKKAYVEGDRGTEKMKADYELKGRIYDYHGMGKAKRGAESTVVLATTAGNLPGAALASLLTLGVKTDVQANVDLRDVKLTKPGSSRRVWSDRVVNSQMKERKHFMKADGSGVFKLPDSELKKAMNGMIDNMGRRITGTKPKKKSN